MKNQYLPRSVLMALLACPLTGISLAQPAPTSSLNVKGTIGVPGCTVSAPDDGIYDFGRIAASLVKPGNATTALTPITRTWTVTCDAQTYLSFSVVDNRAATASTAAATNFGLGNVNGTGKIGFYTVALQKPTVDGVASFTYASIGTSISGAATTLLGSNTRHGWATSNQQKEGKTFTADLAVTPTLAGSSAMGGAITDSVPLDGSLTLNFAFGL